MLNILSKKQKWSLAQLCIVFFVVTTALFLIMILMVLLPKIDSTFDDFSNEADKVTTAAYAEKLQQYIYDRELALRDISSNTLITNASLMGQGDTPALLDYMQHATLLGEDPQLTIIDVVGNALYTELTQDTEYQWVIPVLEMKVNYALNIIGDENSPQFEMAVPVNYGGRAEGVLVARITAKPTLLYGDILREKNIAVAYSKMGERVASSLVTIQVPHSEVLTLPYYGIDFTYTSDHQLVLDNKQSLLQRFIYSTVLGSFILFGALFFIGRKVIIQPFQELTTLQEAIAVAVEGISRIDPQGRYVTLNEAYASAAGYTPQELEGQPWSTTVYEEDLDYLNDAYQTMLDDGKVTAEARGLKKDGSIFYKQVTMISQYDKQGEFIGHHCFLKDITARKIVEDKVNRQQQDLQLIFDNVPVRIWYKDDENRILRLNKNAADSMGGSVSDFEGKNAYDLFPEMAKKYHDDDLAVIQSQIPALDIVEKYTPLNSPPSWVSTDKIPYTDPKTKQNYIFVCSQDITKEKQTEANLQRLNEELSQFAYRTSHDLKAPLVSISGLVNFIVEDLEGGDLKEVKRNALVIKSQTDKLSALVTDILDLARADFDDNTVELIDFHRLIDGITKDLSVSLEECGIEVKKNIPNAISFSCQLTRIRQVLYNLLSNAVKYSDPLKEEKYICISVSSKKNMLHISVEDNGLGFPEKSRSSVFKMFKRFHPNVASGSGLGLSIIKKHVDIMGGEIQLCDNIEETCFKLKFNNYKG
jgi:PAS domain S-box-containing protein